MDQINCSMKSNFLSEMQARGYLNQCTDLENLEKISKDKSIKAYIGFDCTAPSLHVGSLLQMTSSLSKSVHWFK